MRIALDTNVLAFAEGLNGPDKRTQSLDIVKSFADGEVVIPLQALGELYAVLTRKGGLDPAAARSAVLQWRDAYPIAETREQVLVDAMELAVSHRLSFWDAVILAAAADSGCRLLLSEDMQDGFTWRDVTVRNPHSSART